MPPVSKGVIVYINHRRGVLFMSVDSKKDQIKGKTNQAVGKASGDDTKELKGKVQDSLGKAKDKVDETVEKASKKINDKLDSDKE